MPPTPNQGIFFDEYDDRRAYMPNRSHHTNTFDRAGNNHHMVKSARMTRGTRFQDISEGSYVYSTDGPHHTSSSSSEQSISSPGERHDRTLSLQRNSDRNLGRTTSSARRSSHSNSRHTPPRHGSNRSSHTLSSYGSGNNHVSLHDPTSPAGGGHHHLGSRDSHRRIGSSTAYSGSQGSRGHSSHRNHSSSLSVRSLSPTAITRTHQTPLRSTSTVSSSSNLQTPLTSNILPGYAAAAAAAAAADVDSCAASSHHSNRTGLGPTEQKSWSPASSNEWGDGDGVTEDSEAEESIPEQIETSGQGADGVSPGGLTTGASYRTAQEESQTTNNNHSIVSERSTLPQEPTRIRTSARSSKGRNRFREHSTL